MAFRCSAAADCRSSVSLGACSDAYPECANSRVRRGSGRVHHIVSRASNRSARPTALIRLIRGAPEQRPRRQAGQPQQVAAALLLGDDLSAAPATGLRLFGSETRTGVGAAGNGGYSFRSHRRRSAVDVAPWRYHGSSGRPAAGSGRVDRCPSRRGRAPSQAQLRSIGPIPAQRVGAGLHQGLTLVSVSRWQSSSRGRLAMGAPNQQPQLPAIPHGGQAGVQTGNKAGSELATSARKNVATRIKLANTNPSIHSSEAILRPVSNADCSIDSIPLLFYVAIRLPEAIL